MVSNKLLPILGFLVLLMLVVVGIKSIGKNDNGMTLREVPMAGVPDADSPADTIRTLTAEVARLRGNTKVLEEQNKQLLTQRDEIASQVKMELRSEIEQRDRLNQQHEKGEQDSALNQLTQRLEFFKARLDEMTAAQNNRSTQQGSHEDIPVGFGLDGNDRLLRANPVDIRDTVWVEPLNAEKDRQGKWIYPASGDGGGLLHPAAGDTAGEDDLTERYLAASGQKNVIPDRPAYTVPRNATLIGSTGMTALIGRIPRRGTVEDPFPFKVIVGRDNLAANGIEIPGVDGMIFSGQATGDWTLACVRGDVISVTYVFEDGTIRTLSADDKKNLTQQTQGAQGQKKTLGWLSDRRGIPCVSGERISNAADYLSGRVLARAAEAAANAFSQSQTTNAVSALGGVTTSVITGDSAKYAGGKALAGGADEISDYLGERAAQSFDVVYVDVGAEVAIHIDVELPIDYEPHGRKTSYAFRLDSKTSELD